MKLANPLSVVRAGGLSPPASGLTACPGPSLFGLIAAFLALLTVLSRPAFGQTVAETQIRLCFAANMFSQVNENDARAAMKGWAQIIARERNVPVSPQARVFTDQTSLVQAFSAGEVEAAVLNLVDYAAVLGRVENASALIGTVKGATSQEYLVLVSADSPVSSLVDLKGRSLLVQDHPYSCLAPLWLDLELAAAGLPRYSNYFATVKSSTKLSSVVLPVFFHTADACLVTRSGFDTMVEMNPQLGRKLRPIAVSPQYRPGLICVRSNMDPSLKDALVQALLGLHESPTGQQMLALFKVDRLILCQDDCFRAGFDLIAAHRRLLEGSTSLNPVASKTAGAATAN